MDKPAMLPRNGKENTVTGGLTVHEIGEHPEVLGLLTSIVEWAAALLQADAGDIYLYDPELDAVVQSLAYGYTSGGLSRLCARPAPSQAGRRF